MAVCQPVFNHVENFIVRVARYRPTVDGDDSVAGRKTGLVRLTSFLDVSNEYGVHRIGAVRTRSRILLSHFCWQGERLMLMYKDNSTIALPSQNIHPNQNGGQNS